jgi:hypothetical protein
MNIWKVQVIDIDNDDKFFKTEQEATEYAIDFILNHLVDLIMYEPGIQDFVKIFNLIKDLEYDDAIAEYNSLDGVEPISVDEIIPRPYKSKLKDNIKEVEHVLKEIVFK